MPLTQFSSVKTLFGSDFLNCFLDLELDVPPAAEITAYLAKLG
jgi:hypothetical protein